MYLLMKNLYAQSIPIIFPVISSMTIKAFIIYPDLTRGVIHLSLLYEAKNELNLETLERSIERSELYSVDECFLTGTAAEIIPVANIDGRKVATGKPGRITLNLLKDYQEQCDN